MFGTPSRRRCGVLPVTDADAQMSRLAWFSPLPPDRSGIAAYSVELLPRLAQDFEIDAFIDHSRHRSPEQPGAVPVPLVTPSADQGRQTTVDVFSAHDFPWKHAQHPYDLVVYQLGNAICHDYMWPYLFRYPGLVVLHDGQLHHARARLLLHQKRPEDYRSEFTYNHPGVDPRIVELGIGGLLGSLHYFWPMLRTVVDSAKLVAVHNPNLAYDLQAQFPDARVEALRMGVAEPARAVDGQLIRARLGVPPATIVFAALGRVTPEKRISQAMRALAGMAVPGSSVRLLLVGETASYYDALAETRALGVGDLVTLAGFVEDAELHAYVDAADVCLCMRWPSSRETSASWLRCLAAGKPTIVTDLSHTVDVPALVTRGTWTPSPSVTSNAIEGSRAAEAASELVPAQKPICVSIDILDEDDSLQVAMRRLVRDAHLRAQLGENARAFWTRTHTLTRMTEDYRRVIALGVAGEAPTVTLPRHLCADGTETVRRIERDFGVSVDMLNAGDEARDLQE